MSCINQKFFRAITIVNIVTGAAVTLCAISVLIVLLFVLKKYHFHRQRLIMYLNVFVIIQGVLSVVNVHNFFDEKSTQNTYCNVYGLFHNYAIYIQHFMIWWITIDLFRLAVFRIHDVSYKFEVLQIVTTLVFPFTFLWVPLVPQIDQVKYGPDGPICDMQIFDSSNCERILSVGLIVRLIPLLLFLITFVSLYIITIIKLRNQCNQYEGIYNPFHRKEAEDSIKSMRIVMLFPIVYILFFIPEVIRNFVLYFSEKQTYTVLSAIYIIVANFRGIFVSVAFAFDPETCSRLKASKMRCVFKRNSLLNSYANSNLYVNYSDSLRHQRTQIKENEVDNQQIINEN